MQNYASLRSILSKEDEENVVPCWKNTEDFERRHTSIISSRILAFALLASISCNLVLGFFPWHVKATLCPHRTNDFGEDLNRIVPPGRMR